MRLEQCLFIPRGLSREGKSIRMNFPNLQIPDQMFFPYEKAINELQMLLRENGYLVFDRTTLAFFAIGKDLHITTAAKCLINVYQLLNTIEFKKPDRARVEQMEKDKLIEGFARHGDGTFGPCWKLSNWGAWDYMTTYLLRKVLCYIFNMVDFTLLRGGLTHIINARDFTWRSFAPFEKARAAILWRKCCPLPIRKRFLIDLGTYGRIAHGVLEPIASIGKMTVISSTELRHRYPDVVLPRSLTGSNSEWIMNLTCD